MLQEMENYGTYTFQALSSKLLFLHTNIITIA